MLAVIVLIVVVSIVMLGGTAANVILLAEPYTISTETFPSLKPDDVEVTVAVPKLVVDCRVTVAIPASAAFIVVPDKLPSPLTLNVIELEAVVTVLFRSSDTDTVIKDVLEPFATILVSETLLINFVGICGVKQVTSTALSVSPSVVEVTVAVPCVIVDCSMTVAIPEVGCLLVVSSRVPGPVTEKTMVFVAPVTGLSLALQMAAVIKDVSEPSAMIASGSAVLSILTGISVGTVITFTAPSSRPSAVEVTVVVPSVVVDISSMVATPFTAWA